MLPGSQELPVVVFVNLQGELWWVWTRERNKWEIDREPGSQHYSLKPWILPETQIYPLDMLALVAKLLSFWFKWVQFEYFICFVFLCQKDFWLLHSNHGQSSSFVWDSISLFIKRGAHQHFPGLMWSLTFFQPSLTSSKLLFPYHLRKEAKIQWALSTPSSKPRWLYLPCSLSVSHYHVNSRREGSFVWFSYCSLLSILNSVWFRVWPRNTHTYISQYIDNYIHIYSLMNK